MKKILLTLIITAAFAPAIFAQCDKKIIWTAPKAEFLDEAGNLQETKDVKVIVKTTAKEIIIIHTDDEGDSLKGVVKESTCNWKTAFKDGKTIMKAEMSDRGGSSLNGELTIEGNSSKIVITLKVDAPDGKKMSIRIPVDSYKEE